MKRRIDFVIVAAALMMAAPAIHAESPAPMPKPDLEKQRTLYCVSTAHLDTQWNWTIQDTIKRNILNTLTVNFDRFAESPDYNFSFEGAFRYMLMKEYYPALYDRMKGYVAQGRWHVAGSSVDAGDMNVPAPESIIRHILYGNGYFRKEFGKTSTDIFLPDCFGFGYVLPTVAAHCGLKGFSSQKLTWGGAIPIPFEVGRWQGVDGSVILAALNPGAYSSKLKNNLATDQGELKKMQRTEKASGLKVGFKYFGVGDKGGGPTSDTVSWLQKSVDTKGDMKVINTASDQLFRDLTPAQAKRLPLYRGELLMKTHGTGCYTSQAAMKYWNRKNELLADDAERASIIADWLGGAPYPREALTQAWIRFLWHQFHDDLTGTSIPEAYVFSWNDEILSLNRFAQILGDGVGAISRALDTRAKGTPIVVFNPLSIEREDVVQAHVPFNGTVPASIRVIDPQGKETLSQIISKNADGAEVIFLARVPSVSTSVYDVQSCDGAQSASSSLKVTESSLENEKYSVRIDKNGDIASVVEKASGRELLKAPIRLEMLNDHSEKWPAWEVIHKDVSVAPREYVSGTPKVRITEQGPVRVSLEVVREAAGSTFLQEIRLAAGSPGARVEVKNVIDWATSNTLLKAAFPLTASNAKATYDLGIGTIDRGNNTETSYEVPAQKWADLSDQTAAFGVAILNDCKYGWDKPDTSTLRLTLLHTPGVGKRYSPQSTLDFGHHEMTYSLVGHAGTWDKDNRVVWEAARLNQPLLAFNTTSHEGSLGKTYEHVKLNTNQVAIRALKKAEDSDEVVIRLQELAGKPAKGVAIAFAQGITSARELNGAEEPIGPLSLTGRNLVVNLKPYQPRTLAVKLAKASHTITAPQSRPVDLVYDADVISYDGDMPDGQFGDGGFSISGDLLPRKLVCDGIGFEFGPSASGESNAVTCHGQTVQLDTGDNDRLYLLAASTGQDVTADFAVDGTKYPLTIQSYIGDIGQWDSRVFDGKASADKPLTPGYIKRTEVAWTGTHRHTADGKNDPYQFTNLFKYSLPLAKGAKTLTLPDNPSIRIMAVSVASNANDGTQPASRLYGQNIVDTPSGTKLVAESGAK